jgi:hypothetical protein
MSTSKKSDSSMSSYRYLHYQKKPQKSPFLVADRSGTNCAAMVISNPGGRSKQYTCHMRGYAAAILRTSRLRGLEPNNQEHDGKGRRLIGSLGIEPAVPKKILN